MADKVQNIRINFITGQNQDLARAEALLNRAQQSTDKLNQATQKFNQTATQGGRQVASTIEAMTVRQQRLLAQIRLTSTADAKRLGDLSKQYKDLTKQIDELNKKYIQQNQATKGATDSTKGLVTQINGFYNGIRLILTAGIVREVLDMSISFAKLSGNVEGVERAFNRAFPHATIILSELREATHGTVSDFELMQRALQATNLGVNVDELGVLFEFAATRAQQTGESVDYLVDSIVRGIGRKSLLILDNLGLSATRLKEQFNGASLASQSVADVTKGVAEIARVELQKMGGFLETSATKADQLAVSFEHLKVAVADFFTEGGGSGFITQLNNAIDGLTLLAQADFNLDLLPLLAHLKEVNELAIEQAKQIRNRIELLKEEERQQAVIAELQNLDNTIDQYNETIKVNKARIEVLKAEVSALKEKNESLIGLQKQGTAEAKAIQSKEKEIATFEKSTTAYQSNLEVLLQVIQAINGYRVALEKANDTEPVLLGRIEEVKEQISDLQEKIEKFRGSDEGLARLNQQLFVLQGTLHDLERTGLPEFKVKDLPLKPITDATEQFQRMGDTVLNVANMLKEVEHNIDRIASGTLKIPVPEFRSADFIDKLKTEFTAAREELAETSINIVADQLFAIEQAELESLQVQLSHLREFYDEQQILAGDNERAKDQLRIEEERKTNALRQRIAEKEKKVRRFSVILDTAAGIMRAFATAANIPQAIIQAAIVAAQGISQLAIINRTPARFAKGVIDLKGPGTTTSDSIPARLSRRESVMTADETIRAKGILTDIRAKRLDDRVMASLRRPRERAVPVFNDERIISELKEMRKNQPDIVAQYGTLYKVTGKGTQLQKRIRAKRISG